MGVKKAGFKVVHLPFYDDNSYQTELMGALNGLGVETVRGGGGGTFFRTALRTWKADILHFHWLHPYMIKPSARATLAWSLFLVAQILILKARGTKIVWTAHNIQSHESPFPRLERRLQRLFLGHCDAIIAHCECAKTEVGRVFGVPARKIWVVPHGNYVASYPNTISREDARQKLDLPLDAPVLLFLGQIRPYKGVLELVEAFQTLSKETESDANAPILLIAGKTREEGDIEQIQAAIGENRAIRFVPGFVSDTEIQTYMNAADAVVFPYRDILTSGAVLLAMSFERACIAPRRGCISETLDEKGGFLYAPEAKGALLEALRAALQRQKELAMMGKYNGERAAQWDWPSVAQQTEDVYRRAAG
ncbi:MAG TPA: glycosyltransferase family 4 protein [Abditibacterium sp.]|jgi:glycosyltransferase involved in cell wall biosynthesis